MSVTSILPFLMFQNGKASAALDFYARIFPDARIDKIERYGPGEASPEGTIRLARFTIGGQSARCHEGLASVSGASFSPSKNSRHSASTDFGSRL